MPKCTLLLLKISMLDIGFNVLKNLMPISLELEKSGKVYVSPAVTVP